MAATGSDSDSRPPVGGVRLRKVLVVDRDPFWGPSIKLALEEAGYYLNLVADAREGCRRAVERTYDLVILSASVGPRALRGFLEALSRWASPPGVIVLAGADEGILKGEVRNVKAMSVLRRPCAVEDVVEAARTLVGVPWSDHRKGA